MFLYITSDKIGLETGGGVVTKNEILALRSLGNVCIINPLPESDPFATEKHAFNELLQIDLNKIRLAHFYSATYPEIVKYLKSKNIKVTYTVAAHDNIESKKEFEILGIPYDFPHMVIPELFNKYTSSYLNSDIIICPSKHSEKVNQRIGCKKTVVISHGCEPMRSKPIPKRFNIGYLGQIGPDKGLKYLLEAWSLLNYKDCNLHLAGVQTPWLLPTIRSLKKGNFNIMGYVKSVEDFYNSCSIYVQPSVTEGFGIEVLEAMACGRPVIVSDGAGASDVVGDCGIVVPKRNVQALADAIHYFKNNQELITKKYQQCKLHAAKYDWTIIKQKYIQVWKELL